MIDYTINPVIKLAAVMGASGGIDFGLLCAAVLALDLFRACGGILYMWESARHYWHMIAPRDEALVIRGFFSDDDQVRITPALARKAADWMRTHPKTQVDFYGKRNPYLINFGNGTYDVSTGELREHRKEDLLTNVLDADYIKGSGASSALRAFCSPVFTEELLEQKQRLLYQYIGYVVSNLCDAKKALFMIGPANCGKSVVLNFLERVLGREAVSRISLANLADRFSTAELSGKIANLSGEIPIEAVPAQAYNLFKTLVGLDPVTAERKGRDPFVFTFYGTLLFAGNVLPTFKEVDGSDALVSRMALLVFNSGVPERERDPAALEALFEDRNTIISRAVDSLKPLMDSGCQFAVGPDEIKALGEYKQITNSVNSFLEEEVIFRSDEFVYISEAYSAYVLFCESAAVTPVKNMTFRAHMLSDPRVRFGGKRRINKQKPKACFEGIILKKLDHGSIDQDTDSYYDKEEDHE